MKLLALLAILLLAFFFFRKSGWTVYGSMDCGWTRKQLKHLDDKNISYTFVDCKKTKCDHVIAFPTVIKPTGEQVVGFTLVE